MAWSTTVDEFLWCTKLKYGTWVYAGIMTVVAIYCVLVSNLGWGGWVFLMFGAVPMTVSGILTIVKRDDPYNWFYVWVNWYFSFFVFILGSL